MRLNDFDKGLIELEEHCHKCELLRKREINSKCLEHDAKLTYKKSTDKIIKDLALELKCLLTQKI